MEVVHFHAQVTCMLLKTAVFGLHDHCLDAFAGFLGQLDVVKFVRAPLLLCILL